MYLRDVPVDKSFMGKESYLSYLETNYKNTVFSGIGDVLREQSSLDWLDILEDNYTMEDDTVILGNYAPFDRIMDVEKVLEILDMVPETNWYSIHKTEIVHFREIATRIESNFDTDSEFIEYMNAHNINHLMFYFDDLTEQYGHLTDEFDVQEDELYFSKFYRSRSISLETELQSTLWRSCYPSVGSYVVFTITPMQIHVEDDSKPAESVTEEYKLVAKVVDKQIETETVRNCYSVDITVFTVTPISYDSTILDLYPNHHIIKPKGGELRPIKQGMIEVYDENPLPLD